MIEVKLNGSKMLDKATTHAYLKRKLSLPEYYGNNLDALWDCLSTDTLEKKIIIVNKEMIIENLGLYGESLIELFIDVAEENNCIEVILENQQ